MFFLRKFKPSAYLAFQFRYNLQSPNNGNEVINYKQNKNSTKEEKPAEENVVNYKGMSKLSESTAEKQTSNESDVRYKVAHKPNSDENKSEHIDEKQETSGAINYKGASKMSESTAYKHSQPNTSASGTIALDQVFLATN